MNKIAIIALSLVCCASATLTPLDSLLQRSHLSKLQARKSPGFMTLIPLDTAEAPPAHLKLLTLKALHLTPPDSLFKRPKEDSALEARVTKLEASEAKISAILENQQSQGEANTKNLDTTVKIFQLLSGIFGAIVAIVGGIYGIVKIKKGKV